MGIMQNIIKRQWVEQAERDIRELRHEGTLEASQMADLLQEALDECALEAANPKLYHEGSAVAQSDQCVIEGALEFVRRRQLH